MKNAKKTKRSLCCTSLDLRKAFDRVSHHALLEAVRKRGALQTYIDLRTLYQTCSTAYFWEGKNDIFRVQLRRGIKPEDPLFPFLFNGVLNPPMHDLNSKGLGFQVTDSELGAMAYADDIILLSETFEGLRELPSLNEDFFQTVHLQLNLEKAMYFGWNYDSYLRWFHCKLLNIKVGGVLIKPTARSKPICYLGIDFCNKSSRATIDTTLRQMNDIKKAVLKPFQKMVCVNTLFSKPLYAVANCLP